MNNVLRKRKFSKRLGCLILLLLVVAIPLAITVIPNLLNAKIGLWGGYKATSTPEHTPSISLTLPPFPSTSTPSLGNAPKGCGVTKHADGTYSFAWLHVDTMGNVVDEKNCVVHLVGLNQGWLASGAGGYTTSQQINTWHQVMPYNLIRLNVNTYWWNTNVPVPAYNNLPFQQVLKQAISEAEKAGVYIEIDAGPQFHNPPCGGSITFCSSQDQGNKNYAADPACKTNPTGCPEVQELVSYPPPGEQFLNDISKLYANDPAVLFDVWNEPGNVGFTPLLPDPHFFPAMQKRIDMINQNAPKSLVVVFSHSFPQVSAGKYTYHGSNILIDHHSYSSSQTVAQHLPDLQFCQAKGWGTIINEYGGTWLTQSEQDVMTQLAKNYDVGLAYFSPPNLISSYKRFPLVLNTLGQLVSASYTSIFGNQPSQ